MSLAWLPFSSTVVSEAPLGILAWQILQASAQHFGAASQHLCEQDCKSDRVLQANSIYSSQVKVFMSKCTPMLTQGDRARAYVCEHRGVFAGTIRFQFYKYT